MSASFPSTSASPLTPSLPPNTEGLVIHAGLTPRPGAADDDPPMLFVTGRFCVDLSARASLRPPLHRALVFVATRGASERQCRGAFQGIALFPDDEQRTDDLVSGAFQLDAFALAGFDHPGTYHLHCSLGGLLSNVVVIEQAGD